MQAVGFAEDVAGFAGIANERGDRIAAPEQAADDLAADAAGGADHGGDHGVPFRQSSISSRTSVIGAGAVTTELDEVTTARRPVPGVGED